MVDGLNNSIILYGLYTLHDVRDQQYISLVISHTFSTIDTY